MQNKNSRVARVAPKEGNWEAYFADKPSERCLGCTPEEALARLRFHQTKCEKLDFAEKERARRTRPRMNLAILATVAIGGILTIILLLHTNPVGTAKNDVKHPTTMYAHHRMHGHDR